MFALIAALALAAPAIAADAKTAQFNISPIGNPDLCLSVKNAVNGVGLKLANCTDGTGVTYTYNTENGGLKSDVAGDYCIDVKDGTKRNGNLLQHWKCVDYSPNQIFDFVEAQGKKDTYNLKWTNTDYCLDVKDGNHVAGADVQIWRCVPSNTNQQWTVFRVNDPECDGTTDGSMEAYTQALEEAKKQQKRGIAGHRRRTIF